LQPFCKIGHVPKHGLPVARVKSLLSSGSSATSTCCATIRQPIPRSPISSIPASRFLKIGGRVVYRLEGIEAYEAEHMRDSTAATEAPAVLGRARA